MTSVGYISVLLLASVLLCFGKADILSKRLLKRIEALEGKDAEHSAQIERLGKQAKVSNDRIHHLSMSNNKLRKELADKSKTQLEQKNLILKLEMETQQQKALNDLNKSKFNTMVVETEKMFDRIEEMDRNIAECRDSYLAHNTEIPEIKTEVAESTDLARLFDIKESSRVLSEPKKDTVQEETPDGDSNDIESTADEHLASNGYSKDGSPMNRTTGMNPHLPLDENMNTRSNGMMTQRAVRSLTNAVAFHAVHKQPNYQNPQIHDALKFDTVLLNQGNGYHDHHGLFIAPQSGFYLFSASISSGNSGETQASIVKNGAVLTRVLCKIDVEDGKSQGSVVAVVHLNVGDEVWVQFDWPAHNHIWGNGFTSFSGILVY